MTRIRRPSAATIKILNSLAASPEGQHGYALMQSSGLASGTLYPILKRLSDRGWLSKSWETDEEAAGPPRRVYRLTPIGHSQLNTFAETGLISLAIKPQGKTV